MISVFGQAGNEGFALPMVQAYPNNPQTQEFVLAWDATLQALAYVPVSIDEFGNLSAGGNIDAAVSKYYSVGAIKVLGARITGWTAPAAPTTRTTFNPATVTLPQLAERVSALVNDLMTHGMIGN